MCLIQVKDVRRVYNTGGKKVVVAVDNISFSIEKGEIFGLLGPNGAGKTTIIKMLSTLLLPTSGEITINGLDIVKDRAKIRNMIGIIFGGERGLYWRLTGRQNLYYFAELYNLNRKEYKKKSDELLELVGLADAADRSVETYSKGMKQRLHFARGLLNDPDILFMDEPTIGLDPHVAVHFRNIVKEISREGKTILYTSHYMNEADELCDRIAMVIGGKVQVIDTPMRLKQQVKKTNLISITFNNLVEAEVEDFTNKFNEVLLVEKTSNVLKFDVPINIEILPLLISCFKKSSIINFKVKEHTLEDVYLKMVGE